MKFHYYLLINPVAGGGNGKKIGEHIVNLMNQKNLVFTVLKTKYPLHEAKIISNLVSSTLVDWDVHTKNISNIFPLLIVIGGDGTLHQVINSIEKQIPIAYIPAGSGNDFARSLKISQSPQKLLENIIYTTKPHNVNLLSCYDHNKATQSFCVNNVGIGLDASIVHATNHSSAKQQLYKYKMSTLSYIRSALQGILKQEDFPIKIEYQHQIYHFQHAFLCTVTNHSYFGGGVKIAPMADIDEAQIDLVLVEKQSLPKLFYLILLLLLQKHTKSKYFHHFKADQLGLISPSKQFLQKDGESFDKASYNLSFSVVNQLFWL